MAELPDSVQSVTVTVPALEMAPPRLAELPERVQPVIVSVALKLSIPPPWPAAEFWLIEPPVIVAVPPRMEIPPPLPPSDVLYSMMVLVRHIVLPNQLQTPPH